MSEKTSLPPNWAEVSFQDIYELHYGKSMPKRARTNTGTYPVLGSSGVVGVHNDYLVEGPTIIVGRKGSAGSVMYCKENCWPIDTTYFVKPPEGIDIAFAHYHLESLHLEHLEKSTAVPGLSRDDAYALRIALPPTSEQRRIVAKIEELFSELEKGIEALTTARKKLTAYRHALFKSAFEGLLTSDWRTNHGDLLDSPSARLTRIASEVDTTYARALDSWKRSVEHWEADGKKGKRPVRPRQQATTSPPNLEDIRDLPRLPETWQWVKLGQLVWSVKDGPHYSPPYAANGVPFISGGNVRPDGIDFGSAKFITAELHSELAKRCKPEKGDVLYTKGGTTGIARVNTYDFEFNVWVHVAVLKLADSVRPFYLQHALNSPRCYAQSQKYTHGVGNQDLGLTRLVNIILPLCGEHEQQRIEMLIDEVSSELDAIEKAIDETFKKCETLRAAVLREAFAGRLAAQDPTDEPATVLLERIRAARASKTEKWRVIRNGKKEAA